MNGWFEWNSVRCTTYGIHVSNRSLLRIFCKEGLSVIE